MAVLTMNVTCSACPVQIEGTIDGVPYYFRARGEHWSMGIGGDPIVEPKWSRWEKWGDGPFDAGWMGVGEGVRIAGECIAAWLEEHGYTETEVAPAHPAFPPEVKVEVDPDVPGAIRVTGPAQLIEWIQEISKRETEGE